MILQTARERPIVSRDAVVFIAGDDHRVRGLRAEAGSTGNAEFPANPAFAARVANAGNTPAGGGGGHSGGLLLLGSSRRRKR